MEDLLARLTALEQAAAASQAENVELREQLRRRDEETQKKAAEEAARGRMMPQVAGPVDTRLINKPEAFTGKDTEWPQFALLLRAYVGRFRLECTSC